MSLLVCNNCRKQQHKAEEQRVYCDKCRRAKAQIADANTRIRILKRVGEHQDVLARFKEQKQAAKAKLHKLQNRVARDD